MIYPGTDLKFKVTVNIPGFSLKNDDFSIVIATQHGRVRYVITRDDTVMASNGDFFFMLTDVRKGIYYARLTAEREDSNFENGIQHIVDCQPLCAVGMYEHGCCVPPTDGVSVAYQRVWIVNVNGLVYLAESDGTPILDRDGNRIYLISDDTEDQVSAGALLDMTGNEINELLTGRNGNGQIDTIPEVIDAVGGLKENEVYGEMSDDDVNNMMDDILNNQQP